MFDDMQYWSLIKKLTLREIKARYKQSFLGFFWIILNPFFQMLIMSFVFSKIMLISNLGVPYPLFIYAGLLPWTFLVASLTSSMNVFINDASLIKKIYFPREILVISTILAKLFDFLLSLLIFVAMMVFYKVNFSWFMLLFIPIFLIQLIFVYSLSLVLAAFNLYYRDIQYLFNLVINLWFYLTPIVYSVDFFPEKYRIIFQLNPMSVFINGYRKVLFGGDWPNFHSLTVGLLISSIMLFISRIIFSKLEKNFADIA
ncbi:MAG: ABC transporter permease [Microgenomates group bacterium]